MDRLKALGGAVHEAGKAAVEAAAQKGKEFLEDAEALAKGKELPHAGKKRESPLPKNLVVRRTEEALEKAEK